MKIQETKKKISPSTILFIFLFVSTFLYLQSFNVKDEPKQVVTDQPKINNDVIYGDEKLPKDVVQNMESSDSNSDSDPAIEKIKKRFSKQVSKSVIGQLKKISFKHSGTCDVKLVLSKTGVVLRHYVSNCQGDEKFQREVTGKIRIAITQLPEPPVKIFNIARNVEFKVAG